MNVTVSVFGPEVRLKQGITLDQTSLTLKDLLRSMQQHDDQMWDRIMDEKVTLRKGYEVLVNGRNVKTLQGMATEIHDGDEIVLTVMMSGG